MSFRQTSPCFDAEGFTQNAPTVVIPVRKSYLHSATPDGFGVKPQAIATSQILIFSAATAALLAQPVVESHQFVK